MSGIRIVGCANLLMERDKQKQKRTYGHEMKGGYNMSTTILSKL